MMIFVSLGKSRIKELPLRGERNKDRMFIKENQSHLGSGFLLTSGKKTLRRIWFRSLITIPFYKLSHLHCIRLGEIENSPP